MVTDCAITLQELWSALIVIKIPTVPASQFSYITGMLALLSCLNSNLNTYVLPTLILAPSMHSVLPSTPLLILYFCSNLLSSYCELWSYEALVMIPLYNWQVNFHSTSLGQKATYELLLPSMTI